MTSTIINLEGAFNLFFPCSGLPVPGLPSLPWQFILLWSGIHLISIGQYSRALLASKVFWCHYNGSSRVTPCVCELYFQTHGEKGLGSFLEKQFVLMVLWHGDLSAGPDLHKGLWIHFFLTLSIAGFSYPIPLSSNIHCGSVIYNCLSKTNNIYRPSEIIHELLSQCREAVSAFATYSQTQVKALTDSMGRNGKVVGRSRKFRSLEQK